MSDTEKIIRGWERCKAKTCPSIFSKEYYDCEYTDGLYCRQDKLIDDTISLLKEQKKLLDLQHSALRGSADMVELLFHKIDELPNVVRCKDCKYRGDTEKCCLAASCEEHDTQYFIMDDDGQWFCADGVKKDETNTNG